MKSVAITLFPFLLVIVAICFSFCDPTSDVLCIESERKALLKFKNDLVDPSNRLSSWVEGGDCCKWLGVVCHNTTGHINQLHLAAPLSVPQFDSPVAEWETYHPSKNNSTLRGKINSSLLELKHLSSLDLSNNNFSSNIPKFLGMLGSLTYLNLSHAQFQGGIPHNLGNLSKLQYLDLGGNDLKPRSLQWVSGLSSLQYLDLSGADLRKATDWLQVTFEHPSLLALHLSACSLEDYPSPISVNSTKSLVVLDLSENNFSSVPMSIFGLHGLVSIDLSGNSLEGPIPDYFRNISFLEVLDLSRNSLNSSTPNSLFSLNHLQFLNLSSNEIDQDISEILLSLSRCCLDCLESLDMAHNDLFGHLVDQLGHFKNLAHLSLAGNNISGPIPLSIGELSSLKFFDVSENQLNGTFPLCFGQLESLETLNLGFNLLEGIVSETHFSNLTKLTTLEASQNRLRFEPNSSWIPPFQCRIIKLSQWHLGPKFPRWLKFQKNLSVLDISEAGISDILPTWLLNLSTQFEYVNLSCNQLTGGISYLNVREIVDLRSNRFTGQLPRVFPTLQYLILSNNLFSGPLFELVCNSLREGPMECLAIERNLLSGEIPDCWNHWRGLGYLNLENNNLTGKIPPSLGHLNLLVLNLRNNGMFGELPSTLQHSTSLIMLDLSDNHFSGSVPAWIGDKLSKLEILSLRSNNFDGHIPQKICQLQSLRILDLGHNNISGAIPKCFSNLSAMANKGNQNTYMFQWSSISTNNFFYLRALLVLKGRQDVYSTILGLVTSICLSTNRLIGEIPKELGSLVELRSLNVSRNLLIGNIPDEIGNMKLMESLDLSMNQLTGEIPSSFSNLNFLNHFNVSYNNLTGQIPTSTQLQSFGNLSYMGNHLYGPPLTKNRSTNRTPTDVANNGSRSEGSNVNWLYVSIVLGFVMGFSGVVAPLFYIRSWRHAYYRKLDHIGRKLYMS
ncbi:receptor-like protein EIX2 [Gossypium arboreum]|nr:receptor-like protein EIX2 [Gossypium arboreum]